MTKNLTRREKVKLANREAILSAAEEIFAEKGFYAATVDEIAERAEFSKGALYTYFKNKEDIFLSLVLDKVDKQKEMNQGLGASLAPMECIKRLIRAHLKFFEENKEYFQIITSERNRFKPGTKNKLRRELMKRFQSYLKDVEGLMKAAIDKGDLKNLTPNYLAIALIGIINSFTAQWIFTGSESSLQEMSEVVTKLFLEGAKA